MRTSKLTGLTRYLSIGLGVLAPAWVLAQQSPFPGNNAFRSGNVLLADQIEGIRDAVENLITGNVVGDIAAADTLTANLATGAFPTQSYQSRGDGMLNLVPFGNAVLSVTISLQTPVAGVNSTLATARAGNPAAIMVRAGQRFTVGGTSRGGGVGNEAGIQIYWTSLRGNAPAPTRQ